MTDDLSGVTHVPGLECYLCTRFVPLRLLTARSNLGLGARRAIIEGDTVSSSGYLRMFETLRSQSGADIKIFSTVEDAHRWLGLE